jgi:Clostripain family
MANEWTVMVYMAGDNNLSEEMIYAIKEMYRVGVTNDFEVIVQFDPSALGAPVRRYVISKTKLNEVIGANPEISAAVQAINQRKVVEVISTNPEIAAAVEQKEKAMAAPGTSSSSASYGTRAQVASQPVNVGNLDIDGLIDKLKEEVTDVEFSKDERRTLRRTGEINSASPKTLRDFICSSITKHKANHYMLILSGHGSGAIGDFLIDEDALTSDRPTSLSIPNLGIALNAVREAGLLNKGAKIDILGMDSCLMSMAEVGYQLRKSVKLLVGAEGFELATGWPYHRILETLKQETKDAEPKVAVGIVRDYINYYTDYDVIGASTDQSTCDLEKFDGIASAVRPLAQELQSGLLYRAVKDAILLTHWEAQSYKSEQYIDLYDFCDRLQIRCKTEQDLLKDLEAWRLVDSEQKEKVMSTLQALQQKNGVKSTEELLYDQLDSNWRNALQASRGQYDIAGLREFLYHRLGPEEKEAMNAVQALQEGRDDTAVGRLLHKRLDFRLRNAVQAFQQTNDIAEVRQLLYGHGLDPEKEEVKNAVQALQKERDVTAVEKLLHSQLDSKLTDAERALKEQMRDVLQALQEVYAVAVIWQFLYDQLDSFQREIIDCVQAFQETHDVVGLRQLLYGHGFDPEQEEVKNAVEALQEQEPDGVTRLLHKQLDFRLRNAVQAFQQTNDIAEVRQLLYGHGLDPEKEEVKNAVQALQKERDVTAVEKLLHDQLDSMLRNALRLFQIMNALQALKEQRDATRLRQLLNDHLTGVRQLLYDQLDREEKGLLDQQKKFTPSTWKLVIDKLEKIIKACQGVKDAIQDDTSKRVVLKSCHSGPAFQHSHGLSVFFPWFEEREALDMYEKLGFASDTGWARFLRKYLQVTRRERRNQDAHMGEVPVRIDPPSIPVVPLLSPVRTPGQNSRGLIFSVGGMKNPPDGFYRNKCQG